mgnify:CR=1 FL=1|jgi:methionyl aminopeptidase
MISRSFTLGSSAMRALGTPPSPLELAQCLNLGRPGAQKTGPTVQALRPWRYNQPMETYALECHRRAGRIAAECREWARETIKPGVLLRDVLEGVEQRIAKAGAAPAFPAQTSRNSVAAHYCSPPGDETVYEEGDCVKVDVGVHVDGYIGDTACSVDLSSDGRWTPLVQASADALAAAITVVEPGVKVGEIGAAIERTIMGAGFEPVRNLTGHGLGRWKVHTAPQVPNYGERGGGRVSSGSVIAIEPFASTGRGYIREEGKAEVFMMARPPMRSKGLSKDVLREIESWRGLPFARRYFLQYPTKDVEDTFAKLARQGALVRYPPLVEDDGVMVAQTEHTMYVCEDGVEILTTC